MRMSGLASGIDTDEMVKQLMKVERMKVDRVEQQKQTVQWRQEEYNSVNKKFANFILNTQKDMGLKKTSNTGALFGNSYKNVDYVRSAVSSDESIASVTSTGNAANGRFDLHVKEMPKNATLTSGDMSGFDFTGIKKMDFDVNGTPITVGDGTKDINMDDVVKAINNSTTADGKESLGLEAFYDKGTGRIFMQGTKGESETIGEGETEKEVFNIKMEAGKDSDKFINAFHGQTEDEGRKIIRTSISQEGSKGEVTINGVKVDALDGRVNFNGLSIELKAESAAPITINVRTDVEGIMGKVEKFVEDYNKLVDEISGLTSEKIYRDYNPLSPDERKALSEEDLKMWDEKAKSGLLNRDETLTRTLQNMRSNMYKTLEGEGTFNHITQIGISTERYAQGSAGGKLQIDTDKLRAAIEKDADGVMDLLFKEGNYDNKGNEILEATDKLGGTSTKGIFNRIYDDLIDGMKNIIDKSGPGNDETLYRSIKSNMLIDFRTKKGSISDLEKSMLQMDKEIANLNILLDKKEDSHYAKFTAMEKAMYKMNNQSDWLYQQMQF